MKLRENFLDIGPAKRGWEWSELLWSVSNCAEGSWVMGAVQRALINLVKECES